MSARGRSSETRAADTALATAVDEASSRLDGLRLWPLTVHDDRRGSFIEVFKDSWTLPVRPVQWSVVRSEARALRGLYVHRRHDELFVLVEGRALVGLKDLRRQSPTFGRTLLLEASAKRPTIVAFPRGCLHGWYFFEASLHLQAVSEEYDTYGPDDNLSCHWADPDVGLAWPDPAPVVSDEAAAFGGLRELCDRIAGLGGL